MDIIISTCSVIGHHNVVRSSPCRDDYKFSEMIGQKPLIATLVPNLIGHPYVASERQCISGRTLSKMV